MGEPIHRRQGDWVEALFVARATARGLNVSRPWNGFTAYDFVVEVEGRICRVQVKSCSYKRRHGGYLCVYRNFGRPLYTARDFEVAAFYVIPEEMWYIIPITALGTITHAIAFWPHRPRSKYHRFEEAWHLLDGREARATGSE